MESVRIIRELLEKVPAVQDIQITDRSEQGYTVIFKEHGNDTVNMAVICLNRAVPSAVKEVIEKKCGDTYCVITAPYISEASARICEQSGVGYCDFSGNCLIQTDLIYISSKGNPNLYPSDNHAKTIFKSSAKMTSRILRVLMKDVSKVWKIKELAETAGCSIGMVSRVKTYLCEQSWATMDSGGLHITDAETLMREWSRAYEIPDSVSCYTLDSIPLFEEKCFKAFKEHSIRLCLSGFSGGVRYTPVVRYTKAHVWVAREDLSVFLDLTGCKMVDSGANVTVYIADSEEVFADCRVINQSSVASPVQVFLDCMQLKGRGEELAEAVLSKEICR
ncbi:MAG: hypothetical protein IKQ96_06000 [Lachnospiraceae bacterium]|nr:hypothetical protein [Lachnospiraceae bacterium]